MNYLYHDSVKEMKEEIKGYSFNDAATKSAMKNVFDKYNYIIDPHGAVGYLAWKKYQEENNDQSTAVILETAHPVKFISSVREVLKMEPEIPEALKSIMHKEKNVVKMKSGFEQLKLYMTS